MPSKSIDCSVLSTVLTSSYLVGLSPFKLQILKDGSVYMHSSPLRKAICVCLVIGTNLVRIAEVRSRVPGSMVEWTPLIYFQLFCGLINIIFNFAVFKALFYDVHKFLKIADFINNHRIPFHGSEQYLQSAMKWVCVGEIILGILVSFIDIPHSTTLSLDEFVKYFKYTFVEAKYTLFLEPTLLCQNSQNISEICDIDTEAAISDYVIAFFFSIVKIFRHVHGYYGELLLLAGAITLWLPAASFYKIVEDEYDFTNSPKPFASKFESLHEKYNTLKQFSKLVNDAFGLMFLWFIMASIFYYSSNLDGLLITRNPIIRVRVVGFYISAFVTFLFAADISHRVKAFDDWISDIPMKDLMTIPQNSITIIIHELSNHKIGMSGNNIFTITYSYLANLVGVLVTYFVICVQFRAPWADWDKQVT